MGKADIVQVSIDFQGRGDVCVNDVSTISMVDARAPNALNRPTILLIMLSTFFLVNMDAITRAMDLHASYHALIWQDLQTKLSMIVIDLCFSYFAQCAIIKNHGKEMCWCAVKVVQKLCINNVQNHTINYQMLLWRVMNPGSVIPLVKKMHEGNASLWSCQESVYLLCVLPRTIAATAAVTHRLLPLHPCCIAASPLHHPHLHRYGFFFFLLPQPHHIFLYTLTIMHAHWHTNTHTHTLHTHTHTRIIPFFSTSCSFFYYRLHALYIVYTRPPITLSPQHLHASLWYLRFLNTITHAR